MFRHSKSIFHISILIALLASLLGSALTVTSAFAEASIVVNTDTDKGGLLIFDGLCSLREAIANANNNAATYADCAAGSGTDTITFAGNYTITLTLGQLLVTTAITIIGNGAANTIIQANANPGTATYRVFEVNNTGNLTLDGLTVRNGVCVGSCTTDFSAGGGIYNAGSLTVTNATFSSNSAISGGGMFSAGGSSTVLTNVIFSANSATTGGGMVNNNSNPTLTNVTFNTNSATQYGGGMVNNNSNLTLTNVTFNTNSAISVGGGMYNSSSNSTLTNVTFNTNSATVNGGGMYNSNSILTLTNVAFDNNAATAGGALYNESSNLTLATATFSDNSATQNGGGVYNSNSNPTLTNVAFIRNTASGYGGGMLNIHSDPTLTNSTFSANSADGGGGMYNYYSNPSLTNVTFSANSAVSVGGGIYNSFSAPIMNNTIIANSANGGDCYGALNAASFNNLIESIGSNACGLNNGISGNIIGSDPNLGTLTGHPSYFPLLAGSPAIDAGNDEICSAAPVSNTSQNGVTRLQGVHCDIGSYEFPDVTPPTVSSIVRVNPNPTNAASVDFTVLFSESVTGVDASDFSLTTSGVSGVTVGGVSGSDTTYTVSVNTGSGNGSIRLDVVNNGSIKDVGLNPLAAGFTSGESYTVSKLPTSATFADTPITYWAWSYIERLYNAGITGGCSAVPLNYCPDSTVTRAQMAVFLLKSMHGSSYSPPSVGASTGFSDVTVDYWAAAWIKQLAAEGITGGCGAGIYCPDATVTRAQMAVFLLKAKHGSSYSPPNATGVFSDVPVGYWADKWIEQLAAEAVTSGCGAGIYCPDADVTRAQMAVFLVKTFNLP